MRVIALVDGEHHPGVARAALDRLEAEHDVAGVLFAGGEEKVAGAVLADPAAHYGREVTMPGEDVRAALRSLARAVTAEAVVDLSGEPVLDPDTRMELAAVALHDGLAYHAPGMRLTPPPSASPDTGGIPVVAVIGTGKRTGKTALGTHLASLLRDSGAEPVVVSMGRGGPPDPVIVRAAERPDVERLLEIARSGGHAASDYLEDAVLAGTTTVGCRRCGEGPAGETFESNVLEGVRIALREQPDVVVLEGSGAALPPVRAHATVCVTSAARAGAQALSHLGPLRLLRSDLLVLLGAADLVPPARRQLHAGLARWIDPERIVSCVLQPEPAESLPHTARVACFVTARPAAEADLREGLARHGVEPHLFSANLARRDDLARDVEAAVREGCDVFLTELKAAAVDVVAEAAAGAGIRVVFLRNRPVAEEGEPPLDQVLLDLVAAARGKVAGPVAEARS
jgi:cyclic 2,3-diphosphoglycerate synthetase